MNEGVRRLRELVAHPAPGFVCGNGPSPRTRTFIARVAHLLGGPLSHYPQDLAALKSRLGEFGDSVAAVYEKHNGFLLYRDLMSDAGAVRMLEFGEWDRARAELSEWLAEIEDENDPDRIKHGVVFAEVPQSSNYFVLPVDGPSAGKVFYVGHDGWYEEPFAASFDDFVLRVCRDPVKLVTEHLGGYLRFNDGETGMQWWPEEYVTDVRGL